MRKEGLHPKPQHSEKQNLYQTTKLKLILLIMENFLYILSGIFQSDVLLPELDSNGWAKKQKQMEEM